ncbi:MAG TPA: hypothetical protein VFZ57_11460 [Thermoanaerobaculia bacterium]|nr:hypothetical protein [Thermoanaerobaculia bacterium]
MTYVGKRDREVLGAKALPVNRLLGQPSGSVQLVLDVTGYLQ